MTSFVKTSSYILGVFGLTLLLAPGLKASQQFGISPFLASQRSVAVAMALVLASLSIPKGTNAVELNLIMPLLSKQTQATLFSGQRLVWEADTDGDTKALLCPKEDGKSTSGNPRCREYGTEGDKALKQFDPQNIILTLDLQFGLPLARANKVEPQANSGILIFCLVDRALSAAINEESIDDCHGLP
jgi:hypothetical protein